MEKLTEEQALAYITGDYTSEKEKEETMVLMAKLGIRGEIKQGRRKWLSLESLSEAIKESLTEVEVKILIKYLNE